jgi:hypothetical protein
VFEYGCDGVKLYECLDCVSVLGMCECLSICMCAIRKFKKRR